MQFMSVCFITCSHVVLDFSLLSFWESNESNQLNGTGLYRNTA